MTKLIILCALCLFTDKPAYAQITRPSEESVAAKKPVNHIYLTFDDGPLEGSDEVSDAVQTEKIGVTIFVVGSNVVKHQRLKDYYHLYEQNPYIEIGNHSYSHARDAYGKFYENAEQVLLDFLKNQMVLHLKNRLARLPGRNMWRLTGIIKNDVTSGASSADLLFKHGYRVFGWDLEWRHDAKTGAPIQTVGDMMELIEKHLAEKKTVVENHLVLLCHDEMFRKKWEESELKELIERLRATGEFSFSHLSEYPE
ncbi:MAG: polysaccharide deacetylase family protein [Deltaproteobacteria bacterium]